MSLFLIVDDYLPHSTKAAAKMMHELALEFKSKGHKVTVLTPCASQKERLRIEIIDGVEVLYFKSGEIKNVGKVRRAINETFFSLRAFWACGGYLKARSFDGIIFYSPSIFWGPLVFRLKRLWGCGSYLILRDIFPQWTVDNGLMREGSLVYRYFGFFEYLNYKAADFIGVMSNSNLSYFKARFLETNKFEVLFNWAALPSIPVRKSLHRENFGLTGKIVFFYGGNIGHAQHMITLINMAHAFKDDPRVHFLFLGAGDEVGLLLEKKKEYQLDNLTYIPPVSQDIYVEILSEIDVGLFSLHPNHKTHNFPGKILGYMGYAKPILGCVNPGNDLSQIINSSKSGVVVESGDMQGLIQAAENLVDDPALRIEQGQYGRMLLEQQFSVKAIAAQIYDRLM
jgi:glycosyltransferase involved in cell wall biosynthesis